MKSSSIFYDILEWKSHDQCDFFYFILYFFCIKTIFFKILLSFYNCLDRKFYILKILLVGKWIRMMEVTAIFIWRPILIRSSWKLFGQIYGKQLNGTVKFPNIKMNVEVLELFLLRFPQFLCLMDSRRLRIFERILIITFEIIWEFETWNHKKKSQQFVTKTLQKCKKSRWIQIWKFLVIFFLTRPKNFHTLL